MSTSIPEGYARLNLNVPVWVKDALFGLGREESRKAGPQAAKILVDFFKRRQAKEERRLQGIAGKNLGANLALLPAEEVLTMLKKAKGDANGKAKD